MDKETWAGLAPELLINVVTRVQQGRGEGRRVVAIAGVCRSWRQQILEGRGPNHVRSKARHKCRSDCRSSSSISYCCCCTRYGYGDEGPSPPGILEFPWTLLHPGPRGASHPPIQCLLKRKGSYFVLLQTPRDDSNGEQFLLAAKRKWRPTGFSYIIGKDPRNLRSKSGPDVLGKLKSNFWASGFVLWEKRKCDDDAVADADAEEDDRFVPVVSLRFMEHIVNGIRQRRIQCWLPQPCKQVGGLRFLLEKRKRQLLHTCSSSPSSSLKSWMRSWSCLSVGFKGSTGRQGRNYSSARMLEIATTSNSNSVTASAIDDDDDSDHQSKMISTNLDEDEDDDLELRSKVPAWDAQQQCWSLDFKGRASMPSMHNFQLIRAEPDPNNNNNNVIILQLGKIGKNLYTMDFAHPLSAFQAFAICLSSFATSAGLEP